MHHGMETPEDAGALQQFNDSQIGVFTGSVLHTTGALLFTAGIIAFLLVARSLKRQPDERGPWLSILPYAHWFTIIGILLNGAGGVMRLYQSDHPGIDQLGSSLWVQVLLVKHLFLLLGVGLAVWVTLRTQAPEPEEHPVPRVAMAPNRIAWFSITSFVTIILATLLGAVAGQAVLPGMADGDAAGTGTPGGTVLTDKVLTYQTGGTVRGSPLAAGTQEALTFPVVNGTTKAVVELTWSGASPMSNVDMTVVDGDGAAVDGERTTLGSSAILLTVMAPDVPANWTVTVTSDSVTDVSYTLKARLTLGDFGDEVLESTVTLTASTNFFEVNLDLAFNRVMNYSWQVEGSSAQVHFDVHTHRDGQVQYHVDGHYNRYEDSWRQDHRTESGVSLLWDPEQADGTRPLQDIRISYRIEGPVELHSVVGP
jgi:uncharacterized membrane protein